MPDFSIRPDSIGLIGGAVQKISQLLVVRTHAGLDKAAMKTGLPGSPEAGSGH